MENLNVYPRIDTIMRVANCLNVDIGVKEMENINVYYNINMNCEEETYSNNIQNVFANNWGEYVICQK